MTKPLMKYVPQKYYSSIRDFYKDSEGYWLCLKADGVQKKYRKEVQKMKTLKNIKVGDKIFVLFDNTILAEPSEIKILTVEKKGRKFIYSGHYKFNIEYGNNVSNITVRNLTAFATFEEAEEKSKTNRYGIKMDTK